MNSATDHDTVPQPGVTAESLLNFLWAFVCELSPHLANRARPGLDCSLERELALDSLSRMELLLRLERHFEISIPERVMTQADTPRDLLRGLLSASARDDSSQLLQVIEHEGLESNDKPESARTLIEVLDWHVRHHPDRVHLHLYDEDDRPQPLTFAELEAGARKIAAGLSAGGLGTGQTVAIMLPTGMDYFFCFLGILMAGGIPVPIYPPMRLSQMEDHVRRHARILANAQVTTLITFDQAKPVALLLRSQVDTMRRVVTAGELERSAATPPNAPIAGQDIAFIQYTSGSTGNPKGVVLTHQNIIANIRAMDIALATSSKDVFVSWLPLYHDMGLIGAWMGSLYVGFTLVLLSPMSFLSRPSRWLRAIHNHRGTVSGGPNFAFELCVGRIAEEEIEGLDLSCWRMAFNGAEPVSADTLRRFYSRFSRYGLPASAIAPVYGLAEATLGLGFPPVGRGLLVDRVRREPLALDGRAEPASDDDDGALEVVACGQPMAGYQARIVDVSGRELPDREQGRLQFKGPSTTSGYYRNPEATAKLFDGDWLDSGDLAYIASGDIYITSRQKDMIIRGGRNIYPYELEEASGGLEGIRKGCVAVFGCTDPRTRTERLIVVAETRETDAARRDQLISAINERAVQILGMPMDDVVLAAPRTVLKTSSGKIRRAATAQAYEQGRLHPAGSNIAAQFVRLAGASVWPALRRFKRRLKEFALAGWGWLVMVCLAVYSWSATMVLPSLSTRWKAIRGPGRLALRLTGVRLDVKGLENLPEAGGFVLISNHQSYLDGPLLALGLPKAIGFVVKRELEPNIALGPYLKRLGVQFVERLDVERSLDDAKKVREHLGAGHPIGYFPEGTFRRMPGLLPFHMGAFVSAVEAAAPIVPVTIRGSRSMLRDKSWFPRPGPVWVTVSAPIFPSPAAEDESGRFREAVRLRDAARAVMLAQCGEPDLIDTRVSIGADSD